MSIRSFQDFFEAARGWKSMETPHLKHEVRKVMKAAKSRPAPFAVVAVKAGKVVAQDIDIKTRELIPAHYREMAKAHPDAKIHVEDAEGQSVMESTLDEASGTIAKGAYSFADYFGIPVSRLKGFKFDGTDDIEELHKVLGRASSNIKGTENIYRASITESADMLPSYEVLIGLATVMGALDLAQAARGGDSIIVDVAKALKAELGDKLEAAGAEAKRVVSKFKNDPKVKEIIMDAEEEVSESINEAKAPIKDLLKKAPDHVKGWAKWVAQHKDGYWWYYDDMPKQVSNVGWTSYDRDGYQWGSDIKTDPKDWEKSAQRLAESVKESKTSTTMKIKLFEEYFNEAKSDITPGSRVEVTGQSIGNMGKTLQGKVTRKNSNGTYEVSLDNGDMADYKADELKLIESVNEARLPKKIGSHGELDDLGEFFPQRTIDRMKEAWGKNVTFIAVDFKGNGWWVTPVSKGLRDKFIKLTKADPKEFVRESVNEARPNFNQLAYISSAEYQKVKKLKNFNAADWKWDSKKDLYKNVRMEESVNESHFFKGKMKRDLTLGGKMGGKFDIPKKSDMPIVTFKKGEKVELEIQPNSYHIYGKDGKHGYMDKQMAPQLRFMDIDDYVMYESVNEARIIIKTKGKRLAIDKEDLERLKSGKDIVGYSTKYPGQEEWILAIDKWEIEESVNEATETGLMVVPRTNADANKIKKWVDKSGMYGEWDAREGYFLFPEEEDGFDELEMELTKELDRLGVNYRIEGVFESMAQQSTKIKLFEEYFESSLDEARFSFAGMMSDIKKKEEAAMAARKAYTDHDGYSKTYKMGKKLDDLYAYRSRIMQDMEQEAEPEGGRIADRYGKQLNDLDSKISKLEDTINEIGDRERELEKRYQAAMDALKKARLAMKSAMQKESVNEAVSYLYDPQRLIDSALRMKWITREEARRPETKQAAIDQQEEDAEDQDPDEGFGSSDFSYSLMYFMKRLGHKMDVKGGRIVKVEESVNEREYSSAQREDMADSGEALPDGSYPIADREDLENAIKAYGRAKDQSAAAKHIAKRARALGLADLIPDTEDFQRSLKA